MPKSSPPQENEKWLTLQNVVPSVLECITWENPVVLLLMPFWLPFAIIIHTSALLILWSMPAQNVIARRSTLHEIKSDDEDDEDAERNDAFDFSSLRSLLAVLFMLPFIVPLAMVKVMVQKVKNSRFRLTKSQDPQIQSYKSWRYRSKSKKKFVFQRKD